MNVRCVNLENVKTFSTCFKPTEAEIKTLLNQGFKMIKYKDNDIYVFEKDSGTIIDMNKYGIICECSNGNEIWYEPITDTQDAYVERTPEGAIVKVTIDNYLTEE